MQESVRLGWKFKRGLWGRTSVRGFLELWLGGMLPVKVVGVATQSYEF